MDAALRVGVFAAVFLAAIALEAWLPARRTDEPRSRRWTTNLGLLAVDILVQRATVGAAAVAAAVWAEAHGFGLLRAMGLPPVLAALIGLVVMDAAIWAQHLAFHAIGPLWRIHRVHHADLAVDATTSLRFHPAEILISAVYKAAIAALLGIDPWVVILFEALLNAASILTHANLALPSRLDAALRALVITPELHRIHHSIDPREAHSNFGFCLSVWDRLFGTLRGQPSAATVTLGLPDGPQRSLHLGEALAMPVRPKER